MSLNLEHFRFTLFNGITLFVMALTGGMAVLRFTRGPHTGWAIPYYVILAGYTAGFEGSLRPAAVAAGVLAEALIRWTSYGRALRWAELAVFCYVLWRGLGLILLW